MSRRITANRELKLVLVTCLLATTAIAFRAFTSAMGTTIVWTTRTKTTDISAATANATPKRNFLAVPINNGVRNCFWNTKLRGTVF